MRRYETIFIVRPNVGEDDITAVTERTTSIIEGDGGTIIRIDNWGLKKLAYLIKKENQGYYIYIDYAGVPSAVAEIERIFRIDDRILKYLTVKLADSCDPEAAKEELAASAAERLSEESSSEGDTAVSETESAPEEEESAVPEEASASADEEKTD